MFLFTIARAIAIGVAQRLKQLQLHITDARKIYVNRVEYES
jgi:hypothetical protein